MPKTSSPDDVVEVTGRKPDAAGTVWDWPQPSSVGFPGIGSRLRGEGTVSEKQVDIEHRRFYGDGVRGGAHRSWGERSHPITPTMTDRTRYFWQRDRLPGADSLHEPWYGARCTCGAKYYGTQGF